MNDGSKQPFSAGHRPWSRKGGRGKRRLTVEAFVLVCAALNTPDSVIAESNVLIPVSLDGIDTTVKVQFAPNGFGAGTDGLPVRLTVDLLPIAEAFPARLRAELDKRSCRERVAVRSASMTVGEGFLVAEARIWIEKRLCESFVKTRLFEKTGDITVRFLPHTTPDTIRLKAEVTQTGLNSFEEDLADLVGLNPREKLANSLNGALVLRAQDLELPDNLGGKLEFVSTDILKNPPALTLDVLLVQDSGQSTN